MYTRVLFWMFAFYLVFPCGCQNHSQTQEPEPDGDLRDEVSGLWDLEPGDSIEEQDRSPTDTPLEMDSSDRGDWADSATVEPCEPPLRLFPVSGSTMGGTLFRIEGMEFIIGALDWWARIGPETPLRPVCLSEECGVCSMPFLSPPLEPGTYSVTVYYGEPEESSPSGHLVGSFTAVATGMMIGDESCSSIDDCDSPLETCDIGLEHCVVDLCSSLHCSDTWTPGVCDPIFGCISEDRQCNDASDCKLIYSSCGCQAVHHSDPRESLTSCELGGCMDCAVNMCEFNEIEATCVDHHCTEQYPDR